MSKKNIGAALSVIAASAAVATAYATTVTDLENDKHTNSLITEEDKEIDSSYSFVKSDYTKEVKNTKISGSERNAKKASQEIKKDIVIEQTAKTLVKPQIIKAEQIKEEKEAQEAQEVKESQEVVEYDDTNVAEVVNYDDKNLDELVKAPASENAAEVVEYDDRPIAEVEQTTYETKAANNEAQQVEEVKPEPVSNNVEEVKEEANAPVISEKFVNTASLNIRSSKDATNANNIVRSINAGDKLVGRIEGDWFVTNEGYVSLSYLANYYPQDLVNQIKAEAEAKRLAEEARKAEQAKLEEAKRAEEARKAQEAQAAQAQKQQVKEVVREVEQVVETQALNTQAPVGQGAQGAVNIATQLVGMPYVWGSSNPNVGFDCSGLTSYAYRQVGVTLPHSSAAQFNNGYAVDVNNLQVGDLVFFSFGGGQIDHVGIITSSDGTFVHASTPNTGVRIDNIFNDFYQSGYKGARRIY